MKTFKNFIFYLLFLLPLFFSSCQEIDLTEQSVSIPNFEWKNNFNATGSFQIKDTNSTYKIFIVIRHTDAYAYNNIWLNIGLQIAGEKMIYQKQNLKLGSDATGWEGIGMNDIWETRNEIAKTTLKAGKYNFDISQIMRDNPLLQVISVGLRIEKQP
jgi:gliding motility-associated lipoprotein GldH